MGKLEERFQKPPGLIEGKFVNDRGLSLHFAQLAKHDKPLAHIVYVEGLSEYTEKTYELARDFNNAACNFSVFDRPCQGRSPRLLKDKFKQHCEGIEHDVADLIKFCKEKIAAHEKIVLMGHSTGGLIALLAMEQEPALFNAAIMVAPLFGILNPAMKNRERYFAYAYLPRFAYESYIPGGGPWVPREGRDSDAQPEVFSSDPVRNKIHDYWTKRDPELRTGSATCGWVRHMCEGIAKIRKPAFLKKIQQPVLVFTAGRDHLVNNEGAEDVVKNLPNARLVHFKDAGHEILMEKEQIRDRLLHKISLPFLKKVL